MTENEKKLIKETELKQLDRCVICGDIDCETHKNDDFYEDEDIVIDSEGGVYFFD